MNVQVVGVITARGGSKGIPGKNLRPLCGKPLLQYTVESALAAERLSRVIVSTDDDAIADLARRCGAEAPFLRPASLAQDDTPTLPVLQHAANWLIAQGEPLDAICLLQPTCPVRPPGLIDECIRKLIESGADSVVTMSPVPDKYHPYWTYLETADGFLKLTTGADSPTPRRQDLPPAFHRDGAVYVTRRDVLLEQSSLYGNRVAGVITDASMKVNIDTWDDWRRAEEVIGGIAT